MLSDFRCGQCNRLLARVDAVFQVQIKCPRCRTLNYARAKNPGNPPVSEPTATDCKQ
ncbi:Com family DNA-binding transcriptional regulator [Pseudomonas sp. B21128]|uniref:Com family DNA-binding transcriptional regulator n=1 Tax=Pseudomonas TaxID=286 RepID=UPI0012422493|nr:Com family DNA-binding transcriptional regulator [Pseudomonas fluorescens]WKV97458.1 Com family DNA-binding transcriptional regulator [Pseudomonas sp. H22_DOA]